MKKITVYCGESIEDKCGKELHPVNIVKLAQEKVLSSIDEIIYTNNPDMIMGLKYIPKKHKVNIEFLLNGVECGDDIEPVFTDLNRSLDLINELGEYE